MTNQCTNCGKDDLPDWANYCDRCGQPLLQDAQLIAVQDEETGITNSPTGKLAVAYQSLYADMYQAVEIIQQDSLLWGVYGKHRTARELKQEIRALQQRSFFELHEQELRKLLAFRQLQIDDKLERKELAKRLFRLIKALEQIEVLAQNAVINNMAPDARRAFLEELVHDVRRTILQPPPEDLPPDKAGYHG